MLHSIQLAPSLLAADHSNLIEGIKVIEANELKWVHLDIMDGHFVPNLSFGPQLIKDLRSKSDLFFDVHLMLDNPHQYITPFIEAGADQITIHLEPDYPIEDTLKQIKSAGINCGVVLNPDTPIEAAKPYLSISDIVLVMSVVPGFGGQPFREDVLPKIKQLAEWRADENFAYRIEVDGGVDLSNAPQCLANGADTLVAGTSFYKAEDKQAFVQALTAS